jgi:hypothetical protein
MIELSIKIDNRNYERSQEKRGHYSIERKKNYGKQGGNWPQPIELDTTFSGNRTSKDEMDRRYKQRLYFECGKAGYIASFHREGKGNSCGGHGGSYRGKRGGLYTISRGAPRG